MVPRDGQTRAISLQAHLSSITFFFTQSTSPEPICHLEYQIGQENYTIYPQFTLTHIFWMRRWEGGEVGTLGQKNAPGLETVKRLVQKEDLASAAQNMC